ncbi:hypothetical protein ACSDQ9_11270 [Aestuariimicrobium soli]|uniref:hypothetical protein n=1 Tax=Aestuariimicrobium soli TaxID=2035834 RepID=UPI003EBB4732
MVNELLQRVARDLNRHGVSWALVGGHAVCLRAEPRPTADVDIAVEVSDDAGAEALVASLNAVGYRVKERMVHDQAQRLATVRMVWPQIEHVEHVVDLFFASSGVETEVVRAADVLEVSRGLAIPVARTGHLIAVKLLWRASEKRDRDLRVLLAVSSEQDLIEAREVIQLITRRGYHRGKDLGRALAEHLEAVKGIDE